MTEKIKNAADELMQQMKAVKERNANIVKDYNNGFTEEEIIKLYEINKEALGSLLKTAKRDGLLKSPVMEEPKPRRGRPPGKQKPEEKPLLKETDLPKKPKPEKKPKHVVVEENLEKLSPEVKEVIGSFAPEKKEEPVVEKLLDVKKYIGEDHSKTISDIFPAALEHVGEIAASIAEISKSHVPKMDIAKAPEGIHLDGVKGSPFLEPAVEKQTETFKEQVKEMFQETRTEMKKELLEEAINQKPMILPESEIKVVGEHNVNNELNKETVSFLKIIEEQEQKIFNLETQLDRFNHLQDLSLLLMKNTLALVDQAEEQRLEGRQ